MILIRFAPSELSVKLGEWKLGVELKDEEPLPFEIIDVRTIKYHPGYIHGLASNDTAMLILEHPVTFDLHINTLCLPDEFQVQESSQCIVTGWGKSILQGNSLTHVRNIFPTFLMLIKTYVLITVTFIRKLCKSI